MIPIAIRPPWATLLLLAAVLFAGLACNGGERGRTDTQAATADSTIARCAPHGVPASLCFLCDPARREPGRLWCAEHARYEDRCFLCHPNLRDANRMYCDEHGLYEDECFYCHPELIPSGAAPDARSETAPGVGESLCGEHGVPEGRCGICHPDLAESLAPGKGLMIRFPSALSAARAGVGVQTVIQGEAPSFVEALGQLDFNRNRYARLVAPVEGLVSRVPVDVGRRVEAGEVLLEMTSPEWAEARAAFLRAAAEEEAALSAFQREEDLHARKVSSGRDLEDAKVRYESARAARRAAEEILLGLGLPPEAIASLRSGDVTESRLSLRAPFAGTVVSREATTGEVVSRGAPLLTVGDLDPLWAVMSVPAEAASRLRTGLLVEILIDGNVAAQGRLTWIADALQENTRMVEVRAEVPNTTRALRPGTVVQARIHHDAGGKAILVPKESVHRFGGRPFVFLELAPDLFEARRVDVGPAAGDVVPVLAGLVAGERVVSRESYLVKSEFQKSRLGAGCVD